MISWTVVWKESIGSLDLYQSLVYLQIFCNEFLASPLISISDSNTLAQNSKQNEAWLVYSLQHLSPSSYIFLYCSTEAMCEEWLHKSLYVLFLWMHKYTCTVMPKMTFSLGRVLLKEAKGDMWLWFKTPRIFFCPRSRSTEQETKLILQLTTVRLQWRT